MNKEEAINLLEQLVEANMAQGAIKNFETLDKLREAIKVLKTEHNGKEQKTAGGQAGETEKG